MADTNTQFCRVLLSRVLDDMTGNERKAMRKDSGLTCSDTRPGYRYYHFEWPFMHSATGGTFYWEGSADNAYDARAKALSLWLEHHAPFFRQVPPVLPPPQVYPLPKKRRAK